MNKTIVINNIKGGVGKTTIAINLAVELSKKFKVTVIDLDTTKTSTIFFNNRNDIECINVLDPKSVKRILKNTDGIKIVDSAGYSNDSAIEALFLSDLVIMPTMLEPVDIIGVVRTMEKYKEIEENNMFLNIKILPNKIHRRKLQSNIEEELKPFSRYNILPMVIQSKSYANAFRKYQGITEYNKTSKEIKDNFIAFAKGVLNEF